MNKIENKIINTYVICDCGEELNSELKRLASYSCWSNGKIEMKCERCGRLHKVNYQVHYTTHYSFSIDNEEDN